MTTQLFWSGTIAMSKPTAMVRVDGEDQEIESLGEGSMSLPGHATSELASLFPSPKPNATRTLNQHPMFHKLLKDILMSEEFHITRLEVVGFVTPAIIVNRFGMTTRDLAHTCALLGADHLCAPEFEAGNARLMVFAQSQLFNGKFSLHKVKKPKLSWKSMKKTKAHNDQVMQWDEDTLETMPDLVTDPKTMLQAVNELKKVKMTAKKWMKDGKVPHRPLLSNNVDNSSLASTKALSPIEEIS